MSTPATSTSSRLYSIQGLRAVAVLMVFSVHLYETERKYSQGPHLFDAWIHGANSGLDLFLVISGFVLTYLSFGKFGNTAHVHSYAYNRFTRVYPLYLLYTLPLVPVYLAMPTLFNATANHEVDLLRTLLMLPDVNLPLIPVAWTLHHEAYFYIVLGLMLMFDERYLPRAIAAWFVVTLALVVLGWHTPREEQGAFLKVLVNPINFAFVFGMIAAWIVNRGEQRGALWCTIGGAGWMLVGYVGYYFYTGRDWLDVYSEIVIFSLPAAFVTYGVVGLERRHGWAFARGLAWVGDASYSIYLTHVMSITVVGRLWYAIGIPGWLPHLAFLVVTVAVGLTVGKLCYELIEKPLIARLRHYDPARRTVLTRRASP